MRTRLNNNTVTQASQQKARAMTAKKIENGEVTLQSVKASVQQMFTSAGFTFSTNTNPGTGAGFLNVGVHIDVLQEMADDPEKMVKMKAKFLDTINKFPAAINEHAQSVQAIGGAVRHETVSAGIIFNEYGTMTCWAKGNAWCNGGERTTSTRSASGRNINEILQEILEERRRLARSRERREMLEEQMDYISQDDYKSALDIMANRNLSNGGEEGRVSRRFFVNEDGDLMKKIRTDEGVRVINLDDPFAM